MSFKKVVVAGGGVLGSQIAFQAAYCGFDVTIWLRSEGSIGRTQPKIDKLLGTYREEIEGMAAGTATWCAGIADSDKPLDKEACLQPAKTVIATNSSTLLPSQFAKYTGRPDRYLALHFANSIWRNNTAEVMGQASTDPTRFDEMLEFANQIRMIALPVRKEKNGYLLNSMLVPWLLSGLDLWASGVSDPKSIDIAWEHGTGAPKGPFRVIDTVGLNTAYNIVLQFQSVPGLLNPLFKKMMLPYNYKEMARLLKSMIDEGKLGMSSGEGFYSYE